MRNNVLVSVIVPIYNVENYLSRCLYSITHQTYQNLEIICVNDGSTDNSSKILEDYSQKDHRVKIINQKNAGLSAARNTGLKEATGKYITFVDSDDEIETPMIKKLLKTALATDSDITVCSFKETFTSGKTKLFPHSNTQQSYNTEDALKDMLQEKNFNLTATMKLFKKHTLKNLEFPIGKLHEDVGFTYKTIMKAKNITFIPKNYYIYHHHDKSIITNFTDQKFDLIKLTDEMCNDIDQSFPKLKDYTNERRMRARFSILRQIPLNHPRKNQLLNYLKTNQEYITKNPAATVQDRIALKLVLKNPNLFQIAYKLFK